VDWKEKTREEDRGAGDPGFRQGEGRGWGISGETLKENKTGHQTNKTDENPTGVQLRRVRHGERALRELRSQDDTGGKRVKLGKSGDGTTNRGRASGKGKKKGCFLSLQGSASLA